MGGTCFYISKAIGQTPACKSVKVSPSCHARAMNMDRNEFTLLLVDDKGFEEFLS